MYGDTDLEARIQRIIEAREAAQSRSGGASRVMIPPPSSHEWRAPLRARPVDLPIFGQGADGQPRREEEQGAEARRYAEDGGAREANVPPHVRVKQEEEMSPPLDEYFCRVWTHQVQRHGRKCCRKWLQEAYPMWDSSMLVKEFVKRNHFKWVSFDLRTVNFLLHRHLR